MHEYSIVSDVVDGLLQQLQRENVAKVKSIRFRRGSAFSEAALNQAYESVSSGTPLEGAAMEIETVNRDFQCKCGYEQVVTSDDLIGHMFVCPNCGATEEIDEAHDLELVEVVVEDA